MNWTELKEYYKDYDDPERAGVLNAEIYCLEQKRAELRYTPEQMRELATIYEKLEYLTNIRSSTQKVNEA